MITRELMDIDSLTTSEAAALKELIKSAKDTFQVERVILFGSKARGEHHEYSDVDVMFVISKSDGNERFTLSDLSFDVNFKYDTNIYAAFDYTYRWQDPDYMKLPLPQNIQKEGVLLSV